MRGTTISRRTWGAFIVVGLVGQVALTVEGAYLNLFVYNTITDSPTVIAAMVATSAIAATLGTMVVGAISDRVGRRRIFVAGGYLLWGASMMAFGLVAVDAFRPIASLASAVAITVIAVIIIDCVVSLFSGAAYSATFMGWVTDVTDVSNRGRAETVLVTLPPLSLLIAIAALEGFARRGEWSLLFTAVGAVTMAAGVAAWFLVKDVPGVRPQRDRLATALVHGLTPRAVRANPRLYLALAAFAVLSVATQIYMPYLLIYIEHYLKVESYALLLGVALITASLLSVLGGRVIDRVGKLRFLMPATAVYAAGLLMMFGARGIVPAMIAGIMVMAGFMLMGATVAGLVRDYTPPDRVGAVQGVRLLVASMLPSLIGPFIGAAVITNAEEYYLDLGVLKQVPSPGIFLAAAIALVLVVVPVFMLRRLESMTLAAAVAAPRTPETRLGI